MAKAVIAALRDEVRDDLNKRSGAWAVPFKAVSRYQPKFDFEELSVADVQVVAQAWRKAPDHRGGWLNEYVIRIGLMHRPKAAAGEEATSRFDDLVRLIEQMGENYESTRTTTTDCVLMAVDFGGGTGAPYAQGEIETQNKFGSIIDLTFQKRS
jgi:hypothetical protein